MGLLLEAPMNHLDQGTVSGERVYAACRCSDSGLLRTRTVEYSFHLDEVLGGLEEPNGKRLWGRIAMATGLLQGRVSEIIHRTRTVTTLELFERIAPRAWHA